MGKYYIDLSKKHDLKNKQAELQSSKKNQSGRRFEITKSIFSRDSTKHNREQASPTKKIEMSAMATLAVIPVDSFNENQEVFIKTNIKENPDKSLVVSTEKLEEAATTILSTSSKNDSHKSAGISEILLVDDALAKSAVLNKGISDAKTSGNYEKCLDTAKKIKHVLPPPENRPKATSPEEFLDALGVKQDPKNLFTQDDVEQIYGLMQEYPMSSELSLYSLFKIKSFDLLYEMKKMRAFFEKGDIEFFTNKWEIRDLCYYFIRSKAERADHIEALDLFTKSLKESLEDVLNNKKVTSNNSSSRRYRQMTESYKIQEAEYNLTVKPFLKKWDEHLNLLKKILTHRRSKKLLGSISSCLGIKNIMQISSFKEMQNARSYLCKYIKCITEVIRTLYNRGVNDNFHYLTTFEKIAKEINSHSFNEKQKHKQVIFQCDNLLKLVSESLIEVGDCYNSLVEIKIKKSKNLDQDLLFIYQQWLYDFYIVLNHSIIPVIRPSINILKDHERQFYINLKNFSCNIESEPFLLNKEKLPKWFDAIYSKFYKEIGSIYPDIKNILDIHKKCDKYEVRAFDILREKIKNFYNKIRPIAESTLNELFKYAKTQPGKVSKLPLSDMTIRLSQSLIMVYDLNMLLYEEELWQSKLPQDYIELISMESDTELEESSSSSHESLEDEEPLQETSLEKTSPTTTLTSIELTEPSSLENLHSRFSHLDIQEKPKAPTFEIKEPPKTSQETVRHNVAHSSVKLTCDSRKSKVTPSLPLQQQSNLQITDDISFNDNFLDVDVKSLRKLRNSLSALGLTCVKGKRHEKWVYPQSDNNPKGKRVATMVPRHGNLGVGLKKAIMSQLRFNNPELSRTK